MLRSLFSKIWVKGQKIWRTKLNNKLFVKNISFRITEAELSELFASCGEVVSAFIAKDRETGKPRGFAFVEMSSQAEAETAIRQLNNKEVNGRQISVSLAEARPKKNPSSGGGGGFRNRH